MQTLKQLRTVLSAAGLRPSSRLGQNFLIDGNIMDRMLAMAELSGTETVLEVGPATGSLTEELLNRAARVVAVEIDRGLFAQLERRFRGRDNLTLILADALAGKHAICPQVAAALGRQCVLVANLPYNIATPLLIQCLVDSWRSGKAVGGPLCRYDRMTFTIQQEVADRLAAAPGGGRAYGRVSVLVSLLGRVTLGPVVPATAFWPRPKVSSRMVRIDFDAGSVERVADIDGLCTLLGAAFGHRRKQIGGLARAKDAAFSPAAVSAALDAARLSPTLRPEQIPPEKFETLARELARLADPPA